MTTRFIPGSGGAAHTVDDSDLFAQFQQALEEQRRFRTEQLAELAAASASPDQRTGPLGEVSAALRDAARAALAEVDAALARLADGSYGSCQHCDRQISRQRLEIVPMAALCMSCQRQSEADEHSAHTG